MNRAEMLILELAVEDYYRLFELIVHLNALAPGEAEETLISTARDATLRLLDAGLIEVYFREGTLSPVRKLDGTEAVRALSDDEYWRNPNPEMTNPSQAVGEVEVGATTKGEEEYYG